MENGLFYSSNYFFMILSAGVGRTGTYLAIDPIIARVVQNKSFDIYNRVIEMRKYRMDMVQNIVKNLI